MPVRNTNTIDVLKKRKKEKGNTGNIARLVQSLSATGQGHHHLACSSGGRMIAASRTGHRPPPPQTPPKAEPNRPSHRLVSSETKKIIASTSQLAPPVASVHLLVPAHQLGRGHLRAGGHAISSQSQNLSRCAFTISLAPHCPADTRVVRGRASRFFAQLAHVRQWLPRRP